MVLDLNVALGVDEYEESASSDNGSIRSLYESDEEAVLVSEGIDDTTPVKQSNPKETSSSDEVTEVQGSDNDPIAEMEKKLELCESFDSLQQAYMFYCEYGRRKGFSVRRGDQRYKGNTREIRWKEFVCHCRGPDCSGRNMDVVRTVRRQHKRSKCLAKIRLHTSSEGVWKTIIFIKQHNHPLLASDQTHLLRSSRVLNDARLGVIEHTNSVGDIQVLEKEVRTTKGRHSLSLI